MPVELICAVCGTPFKVFPARIRAAQKRGTYPKYCKKACANIGQGQTRVPWSRGLTKETDPRIQKRTEDVQKFRQEHPEAYSGDNHWTRKHPMTPERLEHMAYMRTLKPEQPTQKQLDALESGRLYFKGLTKETDSSVARRAKILSDLYRGQKYPERSERLIKYYEEHPERHVNFILAQKGHETSIERIMRIALESEDIDFEIQYHIKRYFVDFAILACRLAIEVDGEYWHDVEKDAQRDYVLNLLGWRVIRFSESRVKQEIHQCISEIRSLLS